MSSLRGWPWPFLLLILGAGIATSRLVPPLVLSSSVVLTVFLPPLLFDAGFSMELTAVRREWRWITLLGLLGSVLSAMLTFVILVLFRFPAGEALLLSAVLAATDPVSVFAALRRLRTPPRLRVTLEGESLANDAVAVVLFALALAFSHAGRVEPVGLLGLFLRLSAIGLVLGALMGLIATRALRVLPAASHIPISLAGSYLTYLLSDRLGGSGLLSVIAFALLLGGWWHSATHHRIHRFWRRLGLVMAAVVFLLVGLQVRFDAVLKAGLPLLLLIVAVWIARFLMILTMTAFASRLWPWRSRLALTWAGLRGALSLALALSLPPETPRRSEELSLVFGFVFISLALQGVTIGPLFRLLRPGGGEAVAAVG